MNRIFKPLAAVVAAALLATACKKEINQELEQTKVEEVSQETLAQVKRLGFSTGGVQKVDGGYLVEGDILLTPEHLRSKPRMEFLRVGDEEQYRTSNTVL